MRIISTGWSQGFDGPGRRWVVYLKGCNFRCKWCANPESLYGHPQMLFYPERGEDPSSACPYGAVKALGKTYRLIRSMCKACLDRPCINQWHSSCFELSGVEITPSDIAEEVCRIKGLFGKNGGVTFGGGEATLQREELLETVALLRGQCHLAIETNGSVKDFNQIIEAFDLLIIDLKCVTDKIAHQWIGHVVSNTIENIKLTAQSGKELIIRIPFVKGVNDREEEKQRIASVLSEVMKINSSVNVEILRMHHMGVPKYKALDMVYEMESIPVPSLREAESFTEFLIKQGVGAKLVG